MTDVSRRLVLGTGVSSLALALASTLEPTRAGAAPAGASPAADGGPTRADYARHVGHQFSAVTGTATRRVTLRRIEDSLGTSADPNLSFTLVFEPVGGRVREGIYSLHRRGVRNHTLLLHALGTDGLLQAVVNRAQR
ncbi:hypothetical protein SAMN05443575_2088 [Jatrophihabitans endophyticus]|uniref:DUF6916 domain-containing protein n=1 Tax=Jatrophihabitans endophyticus TaxID=1206085 RepID=A0A1M5K912_9ACTN|nr:hypothetical protein [Jatrophihabitans endophyticus]SHG49334.1 hypothetical protein SAMN05443575_2088 [Jatrophihabitans endophyticus]